MSPSTSHPKRRLSLRTRIIAAAFVAILLLFAGIWPRIGRHREAIVTAQAAESKVPEVLVSRARVASANSDVLLPGNTEAINVASIYARANGYITRRYVDIGSRVKAGQVLALIESPEVDQELAQARAS